MQRNSVRTPKWISRRYATSSTCTNSIGEWYDSPAIILCLMLHRDVQGPTWGYPTEGAYYRDASCADSVLAVRIPLFAIHAEDDPVNLTG